MNTENNAAFRDNLKLINLLLTHKQTLNPIAYHLAKIQWAAFGTLTWKDSRATKNTQESEARRKADFFRFIRATSERLKLRHRKFAFYRKTEFGKGMRGHCNFLLAREGTEKVSPAMLAAAMQSIWQAHCGLAKIEPFDEQRQLKGVNYQSKTELDSYGNDILFPEDISRPLDRLLKGFAEGA